MLQCVAVCCRLWQCVLQCDHLDHVPLSVECDNRSRRPLGYKPSVLQCVAMCCSVLQCGALCFRVLQVVAVCAAV